MTTQAQNQPRAEKSKSPGEGKTPTSAKHQIQRGETARLDLAGADLTPGLGADFPLRLELVLADDRAEGAADGRDPFVVLSDGGRNSRVYLGRIRMGSDASDRFVAIKFQTPRPPYDASEDDFGLLTHQLRELRWLRELKHYQAIGDIGEGFTPLLFIEPPPERSAERGRPRPWPALLYCKERRLLFQPRDAAGGALATCRDDGLLREKGLPPYRDAVETILYDPEAIERGSDPEFFLWKGSEPSGQEGVESLETNLERQASIPGMPGTEAPALDTPEAVARFTRLGSSFPCLTCPEREPCYGEQKYQERLTPFCAEETNALVMELNSYHYDEFCDLLGGIGWKEFERTYLGEAAGAGRRFRLLGVEERIQHGRRYMFGSDGSGMDALEIFKLKWTLYLQTCQAVFEFQRRTASAHLRIEPRHVMIAMDEPGDYLPTMWQFRARLISLGAMTLPSKPEEGDAGEILIPPVNSNPAYDAEILRNSSFGIVQRGAFVAGSVESAEQDKGHVIQGEIHHDGIALAWLSPKDRIKVTLRGLVGNADLTFMATRDPDQPYSQSKIALFSAPLNLSEEQRAALDRVKGLKLHNAGFVLYPTFQAPCDAFSLGMLLFRTLLVNDRQSIGDVSLALDGLKQDLNRLAWVECEEGRESEFWDALIEGREGGEGSHVFDRNQVFYSEDDRYAERPNAIPPPIWSEAMALGLQMITQHEGFSVCETHGDYDIRYPAGKMEPVLRRGQELLRKIDTTLLAMSRRNAEIRAALESVITETMT